jgi:hypothetical protein
LGAGKGALGIDHPFVAHGLTQQTFEGSGLGQRLEPSVELELALGQEV